MDAAADSRWERIKELFATLLSRGPAERARLLDEACGEDADLRGRIQELLDNYDEAFRFFKRFPDLANVAADLSARTFSMGDTVAGRFRIVDFLGHGGMGEVYEAEDLRLSHEHIALKTLRASVTADEKAVHRLNRELQLARSITHPNVCRVHDVGQHQTVPGGFIYFFTMELLRGGTLADRLRLGKMTTSGALPIVRQMVMGLHAAHSAGVVHGDFKPGNVILVRSQNGCERVAVTDFGLARWIPPGAALLSTTRESFGGGTPAYMAPEQFRGRAITPATDIYALGIVVYELVTGQHPFRTESPFDLALGKQRGRVRAPIELDSRWQRAIQKCLEPEPERRFESALDVLDALERKGRSKPKWMAGVGAVVAAAVLGLTVVRDDLKWLSPRAYGPDRTIAVMPFENVPHTPEGDAWGAGLAAVVTDHLVTLSRERGRGFHVVPATEVMGTGLDTPNLVKSTLGANLIVTGRIVDDAGQKSLTLTPYEASRDVLTGTEFESVTLRFNDRALVQKQVLSRITRLLGVNPSPEAVRRLDTSMMQPGAEHSYLLARGYLAKSALLPAISALETAVQRDGTRAVPYAELSDAYLDQYDATNDRAFVVKARSSADTAVERDPDSARAHVARGRVYRVTSERERAISELQRALDLDPDIRDARVNLAATYETGGSLAKAEEQYREEIRRHPQYWRAYNAFGGYLYFHGRYPEATTNYVKASEYAPSNRIVIGNLAGIYLLQGRFAAAENQYLRGLRFAPTAALFNQLGWLYIIQGKFTEAIEPLKQAVQLPQADSVIWSSLARACRWEGHHPRDAKRAYERALQLSNESLYVNPDDTDVRSNRAYLLVEMGRQAEALREIAATLAAAPTDSTVLFRSAVIYELAGDRAGALKRLEAAARQGHSMTQIKTHPDLKALRTDPRFARVIDLAPKS